MLKLNSNYSDLKSKHLFITGGGSGIGAYLSAGFIQQGAKVSFIQRSEPDDIIKKLQAKHPLDIKFIRGDLTSVPQLKAAILTAKKNFGAVDILINNAGNDVRHDFLKYSVAEWDKNMAINLRHYFFTAQAVAKDMIAKKSGSIINVSSISYLMGNSGYPAYVAANAAITGLTRALARELGIYKIRVNALLPGWVLTAKQLKLWAKPAALKEHLAKQALKEHLQPEDMVEPALFLASAASKMMTSQALIVDGGVVVSG